MKIRHILKNTFVLLFVLISIKCVVAQNNNSAYFMEGMYYRHNLNPAFASERSYINLPFFFLGNLNVGVQSNIGIDNFIYKYNQNGYSLTTFMNPTVDANEFLSRLNKNNKLLQSADLPIVAFGFNAWGGFNSFSLSVKSNSSLNLPYDLFNFAKTGMSDEALTEYDISDFRIQSNVYAELALGHARSFLDNRLSVGAKVKFLVGAGNVDANIKNMRITMSEDKWNIKAEGELNGSVSGAYFKYDDDGDINGADIDKFGIGGFGGGIDLGAAYDLSDLVDGLKVSTAVLDLGFIKWKKGIRGTLKNEYTFNGFELPVVVDPEDGDPGSIDEQLDKIGDDLKDFVKIDEDPDPKPRTTSLAPTINIGAEYALPMYKKLRFGFLSSTRINGPFTWSEARISANVAPVSWVEASVNYAYGSFGSSFGWVLNFHPRGFNFFIGTNHLFGKVTPQGIPVGKANAHINIGFNITWRSRNI